MFLNFPVKTNVARICLAEQSKSVEALFVRLNLFVNFGFEEFCVIKYLNKLHVLAFFSLTFAYFGETRLFESSSTDQNFKSNYCLGPYLSNDGSVNVSAS